MEGRIYLRNYECQHKLIMNNYKLLKQYVDDQWKHINNTEKKADYLIGLWEQIDELKVIWIKICSEEEAFEIE